MDITAAKTTRAQVILALRLAWPAILENLLVTMVNIIDTAMVGSLGANATAAVALTASPTWVMQAVAMSANVGCSVLVARHVGAGEWDEARSGGRQSLVLGLMFGVFFLALSQILAPYIPLWMGGEPQVIPNAIRYIRIISLAYPLSYMAMVMYGAVRGSGNMSSPMKITALTNILNIIGNFLLIFPTRTLHLGPWRFVMWGADLGVVGAAISTAIATALSGVFVLAVLFRRREGLYLRLRQSYRLVRGDMAQVFAVGIPTALERVTVNLGQVFFVRIVSGLGTVQLAAHQLAVTAESISYNPGFGFAAAATTLVGQSLGAKDEKLAQRYGSISIWACFFSMLLCGALLFVFARPLLSLFTPDEQVIAYGATALRIVAFAQPLFGMALTGTGVLRGVGDAKITVPIALVCMMVIRLSAAALFVNVLHWGLAGAWYAMVIDLTLRGLATTLRFYSGKWKSLYPKERVTVQT